MRPRVWRIMMWTALAATVVLVGGAVGNRHSHFYWKDPGGLYIGLNGSAFFCGRRGPGAGGWIRGIGGTESWWWLYHQWGGGWSVGLSLWVLTGATFAASTMAALKVYRPRLRLFRRPGHCSGCGYDLSGLPSATCPECGRGASVGGVRG